MIMSRVRLRALGGEPLTDERVRETVVATARAIAERTGVMIGEVRAEPGAITVTLGVDKIAAMGFLAELRRLTNAWYENRCGRSLWGGEETW